MEEAIACTGGVHMTLEISDATVDRMLDVPLCEETHEERMAWFSTYIEDISRAVEAQESVIRNGLRFNSEDEVARGIEALNAIYNTFMVEVTSRIPLGLNDSPEHVLDFTTEQKEERFTLWNDTFHPIAERKAELEYILDTFTAASTWAREAEAISLTAPSLNPGVLAATIQTAYDSHISRAVDAHTEKAARRNDQIKVIDRHLNGLHEQATSGIPIDKAVIATHIEAIHGIKDDLVAEFPELTEYLDLPALDEDTVVDERFIRNYMTQSEILKARAHSSQGEHANEISKLHQLYILVCDVMKNMQKMQQDATSAIIRRTGN